MSSPSEKPMSEKVMRPALRSSWLAAACAIASATVVMLPSVPGSALAGVTTDEGRSAFERAEPAAAKPAPARYQLRCWQYGQVVIDEGLAALPDETAAKAPAAGTGVRLRATDVQRKPLFLTETRNATCLVRATSAAEQVSGAR